MKNGRLTEVVWNVVEGEFYLVMQYLNQHWDSPSFVDRMGVQSADIIAFELAHVLLWFSSTIDRH